MSPQEKVDAVAELERQAEELRDQANDLSRQAGRIAHNFPAVDGSFPNSDATYLVVISEHELEAIVKLDDARKCLDDV